jgi:hypothetical protein
MSVLDRLESVVASVDADLSRKLMEEKDKWFPVKDALGAMDKDATAKRVLKAINDGEIIDIIRGDGWEYELISYPDDVTMNVIFFDAKKREIETKCKVMTYDEDGSLDSTEFKSISSCLKKMKV